MPTYSISGPDGRTYSIEGPEGATREQVISAIQARLAEQPVETVAPAPIQTKESTIGGEFRRGISSLLSGARTGVGAIFGSPEEAAMAGVERSREISEAAGEGPSLSRIGRVYEERGLLPAAGQVAADVPKLLAQQAPQIGTAFVGGRLGALAGSPFGPPGMLVGGALGAAAALAPSIFGQSIERQAQEQIEAGQPVDISTGRAAAATLGSVALEATGLGLTLGKTAVKSLLGVTDDAALLAAQNKERLARAAEATLLGTAVRGAGRGAVVEMPVEVAQSVLERWQAGLDVTSPEALQEYGEAMYAAGLVGGPLGAVGGIQTRQEAQRLSLAPGQEPGESLYDTAARLNAQIQTLDQLIKQADVEAAKSQIGVMSGTDLIDMYRNQGYGAVKQYQISLEEKAQDTELSKEQRQEAAKAAKDVGSLLEQVTTEEVARKFFAAPNVINNRDIDNLGFSKDDPVRDKILNKDINNPDQAAEILSVLEAEKKGADPVRLETINTALETINGYLGSAFYGAIQQPSREGVSVAGVPGGRPAAARPPALEPTGVVRPETDVRGVVGRAAVEPAPVAPVTAPQSLAQVGDAGTAIVANMYQAMLDAHQQGKTVVGGIPDPVLIAAARDGRQFKTIDEIKVYAQQPSVLNRSKNIARGIQIQNMMRAGQTLPDIQKTFPKIDVPKVLEKLQQELTPKKLSITPELEARAGEILKAQEAEAKEAKEAAPEVTPKTEKEAQIAQRQALITQLDGVLKRILAKYGLKDVKLNLKEALSTDPEGEYQRQVITLALNVDNPVRVLRHESIHALKDMGFFSDAQWKTLTKRANDEWIGVLKATPHSETQSRYDAYIDLFTQEGKAKGLSGESLTSYVNEAVVEEAIADAFGGYDATKAPPGLMSAILNRMRNLFKAIKEAFNLSGIETAEEIFGKIEKGKLKPAVPAAKELKPSEEPPTKAKPEEEKPEEAKPSLIAEAASKGKLSLRDTKDFFIKAEDIPMSEGVEIIRDNWIGGVSGIGDRDGMYYLYRVDGGPKYTAAVRDFIKANLGENFKGYRLMSQEELEELRSASMGSQFVSFTLNPNVAKAFKNLPRYANRKDLVVVEMDLTPEHVHMIGHPGEQELVIDYGQGYNPSDIKVVSGTEAAPKPSLRSVPLSTRFLMESNPIFAMNELGLKTEGEKKPGGILLFNDVRSIANALNRDTINNYGSIPAEDTTANARNLIANAIANEVAYQVGTTSKTGTGLGWYSNNYPKAVQRLAKKFPELATNPHARSVFSALVAVTSNGEKVALNIKNAIGLYETLREGKPLIAPGSRRATALENNLQIIQDLLAEHKTNFKNVLLREILVKDMNAALRARGEEPSGDYLVSTKVPAAAIYFGPKLGAFYANLEGAEGYLTMDLWWTRSLNRMRGLLIPKPTESSINRFREFAGDPNMTREEVINASVPIRNRYEELGWTTDLEHMVGAKEPAKKLEKPGWVSKAKRRAGAAYDQLKLEHDVMKMANTIYKNQYEMLEEAPFGANDREFMYRAAREAQKLLKQDGIDLSLADIQAALWYYEKRLYQHLSGRQADDIGYDEAISAVARESDRPARPSVVFDIGVDSGAISGASLEDTERVRREPDQEAVKPEKLSLRSPIGLYSELENKIEAVSSKAAPAAQWKAMINAMPQKGVKPEEIEWSGVNDWLDLQEGKVTKDALLDYLKKNGVQVEEVVLSAAMAYPVNVEEITEYFDEPATPNGEPARKIYRLSFLERGKEEPTAFTAYDVVGRGTELYEPWGEFIDEYTSIGAAKEYVVGVAEFNATQAEDRPRYDSYVLPNGKNYREVLLTLPIKLDAKTKRLLDEERLLVLTPEQQAKVNAAKKKAGIQFISSHWEQPNVLAHIRLNDRVDADGNKVLFVEEIQSDWGQEGKKKGFKATTEQRVATSANRKEGYWEVFDQNGNFVTNIQDKDFLAPPNEQYALYAANERLQDANVSRTALDPRVIAAPFVTKTEGWLNLALKRIMIMAAEGDYDKVAFVNGAQSADRYDLSKQVNAITAKRNADGSYDLGITIDGGRAIIPRSNVAENDLPDLIGKEMAQKIVDGTASGKRADFSGIDLKVGGEGMKAFYDTIVPTAVKKLLPKVGGNQLGQVMIPGIRKTAVPMNSPQPGFDVTPEMKEKIAATGLPKFSLRSLVSNAMTPQVTATVNKIAPPRYDPTLWERILNAVSGDSFTKLRSQIINRYEILAKYDRRVAEMIRQSGGVQQLADQKAESAALFSDLTSGLLASALGANDKFGGAPVFRNGITVISNQNGTVKGPVLIFKPLADLKSPEVFRLWQTYVAVKRGVRLDALGKEHLIDQADVKAMKTMAQSNPQLIALFESVRKDWIKYNDALVKYMQDTGVITPKMAQEWTRHGDYFPFYRLVEEDVVGPRGFRSIANVTPPKALKGGENPLGDFFENVVRNSQAAIQAGIKNVAAQRATEQGLMLKEVVRLPRKRSGVNVYRVLENGQEVYYESADPLFIDAIKSLNMPDLPFLGLLAGPANLLRNLVTKDPAFMLANMMRDSLSAYTTSGVKMTPFVDTIKNFGKAIANRSPETRDLYAAGVLGGYDYSQGVKTSAREFEQRLREVSGTKTPTEKLLTPITSLWGALEKGTQASDAATRAEVYKRVLAETGNEAEAYWQALEVMNFNRRGNSPVVRVLTAAIPFLNARMQGLDLLYRTAIFPLGGTASEAAKQRMKTFWVRGMTLMSLSMMYWALTHDDEEYKKQEQETRDNYWLFPSLGIKIPIPFEVGVMFKVIPERLAALTLGDDTYKDFTKSMVRQLTSTFGINLIPQAALPIAEVTTNYSFFTGRSIIGKGLEDVAPQYQIAPGTSRVAEMIGQSLGMSPIKLDHLLKGYTGSLGMYASDLFDMVFDMNSDAPKASKRFEQMPIIKRFALDPEARGTVTAYYELKDSVDEVVRTSNLLERSMNYKDYGQYMTENIRMLATKDYINALERNMKEFREMKLAIRTSAMSAEAKRDALTSIGRMESQLTQNIQTLKKNAQ